ncbi:MAG: tRNA pseudouridine(55) synthase TruB [Balneolaceae bacterium]
MAKPIPLADLPLLDRNSNHYPSVEEFQQGLIIPVDKPEGFSSFDAVKYVRNRIPVRKVGHAGTLDPLATGLLILCCGKATRTVSQIQELPKIYEAEITFGASTPSFDRGTDPDRDAPWDHVDPARIEEVLNEQFTGVILQAPPIYSALKKEGKRLYKLARKGVEMETEKRPVEIHEITVLNIDLPRIELRIRCGKGTYIRSLAYDLGLACNTLAYLSNLRRTQTGLFGVESAWELKTFNSWVESHGDR